MRLNFTKKLLAVLFVMAFYLGNSQTTLLTDTFRQVDVGSFNPVKWNLGATTADWSTDDGGILSNLPSVTPQAFALCLDASGVNEDLVSNAFSTVGFASITVTWNEWRQATSGTLTLEYSTNGSSWNVVSTYTDNTNAYSWVANPSVTLPSGAEGKSTVYLRWRVATTGAFEYIGLDDINVVAQNSFPVYYYDGSGDLADKNNWGVNTDGSGTRPANFINDGQTFKLHNTAAATLVAAWNIQGNGSKLEVGDGAANNVNLTIPSGFALTLTSNCALQVYGNSTLTIQNSTLPVTTPSLITLSNNSTVDYSAAGTTSVMPAAHYNAIISTGDKQLMTSVVTTFNGALTLTGNIVMDNVSPASNLIINSSISGAGLIKTGNSRLNIGGTGNITLNLGTGATTLAVNNFTLNRPGNTVTLGTNLTVNGGFTHSNGIMSINGKLLTLNGVIIFPGAGAGSLQGSLTSSLTISGAAGNTISGSLRFDQTSAATRTMFDVTLNRSTKTVTLGTPLEIWGTLLPTAGTFAAGSNLTIKSNASTKGRIGVVGSSGNFTGNPTVEVFKKAGLTNWVNMCSGGVIGGTMAGWNSSFAITCLTCPDGTQVGGVTFTSIYTYDESAVSGNEADPLHYIEITALGSISSTEGYWVFIGNGFPNTTAITVPLTGSGVNVKGSASWNLSLTGGMAATNGWHLIANPYPSPISVANVLSAMGASSLNIDNTFYAYDSNLDVNTPFSATGANSVIPMGQAFSVRTLQNGLSITSNESWKTATPVNTDMLKLNASTNYFWDDFLLDVTSTTFPYSFFANAYFTFSGSYTNGFDNGKDAFMTGNGVLPGLPSIYSTTGGQKYLRNALPSVSGTIAIPLTVSTATSGVFQITAKNFNKLPAGACVSLFNLSNSTSQNLKSGPATVTVTANASAPQYELRITVNPGTLSSSVNNPFCSNGNDGSVIAQGTSTSGPWNYTWKDASSNIIKTSLNKTTADTLKNIGVGGYQVDVNTTGSCDNASANFVLNSTAPLPVSAFSINNDTLNINGTVPFIFTNNSSNASTYIWSFGDGNYANTQNASYMYSHAGHFNVSLTAISSCGDSAFYSYQVHAVNSPTLQSVLSYQNNDNSIKVGKDARGVYVELSFDKNTKATISANNILGQVLITPMQVETTTDKYYLDLNAKEQIIFVTVTTNEKRFTQKIFHNQ